MTWWKRSRLSASHVRVAGPDALSTMVSRYGSGVRVSSASTVATRWSRRSCVTMMMSMGLTVSHDTQGPETPERPSEGRFGSAIASNYAALAVQVLVLLALTPLIVAEYGRETLGAWAIVLAVNGYIRLLDLGFGQATSRYMATHADRRERQVLLASSVSVLSVVGLIGIVAGLGVAAASDTLFGHQEGLPGALAVMSVATGLQ